MSVEQISILMDMVASLLALVSWGSSFAIKILAVVKVFLLQLFKGWRAFLLVILGVSVLAKCSADLASVTIIPMGVLGGDVAGISEYVYSLIMFAAILIVIVFSASIVATIMERTLLWFLVGNVQRKWVITIASIVFLSSCLKMYASLI